MRIPSNVSMAAQDLNDYRYIPEIFDSPRRPFGKPFDQNLASIQNRLGSVMDTLSKIWTNLERMTRPGQLSWICLLVSRHDREIHNFSWKAFNTATYHRRINILYNLNKDFKQSKFLLEKNAS